MRITTRLFLVSLATIGLAIPHSAVIARGSGGGSPIRIEDLGKPSGSLSGKAMAINDNGTVIVGSAYWDATLTYSNGNFATRWTRSSTTGAWLAEDLRPLLPRSTWSWGEQVNNAGTATFRNMDYADGQTYSFVVTMSNSITNLGSMAVPMHLSEAEAMAGIGFSAGGPAQNLPLFWPSTIANPQVLPVLESGFPGQAYFIDGANIIGTADDAAGKWLVRWSGGSGNWTIARIALLPPTAEPTGLNSSGRLSLWICDPLPCNNGRNARAAVWDPPYAGRPTYLPTLTGPTSRAFAVAEDGTVVGDVVASNGYDMLPVIWPTPTTVVALPLLASGKAGSARQINSYKQLVGHVEVAVKGRRESHAVLWTLP